ncbi:MAG: CapA family protein [Chloroflexi bacterium]|nr:CapA family protein [Chloroflexota bacterium]
MTDQTETQEAMVFHTVGNVGPERVEYGEPLESLFSAAHQKIKEADVSLCQMERLFSTRGCLQYREHNTALSRVDPENVKSLVFAGFNVASFAGNNCFAWGPDALLDSIDAVRSNGVQVIGAGKDIAEAREPAIVERKGIKLGLLAYNSVLPVEFEAREGKPGCAPLRVSTYFEPQGYQPGTPPKVITVPREDDLLAMEEAIRKLRNRVDAICVSIHWGQEYAPGVLAMYQPVIGHRAIDAGADLIVGHHGPTLRGIEIYKGKAILYCLGNFALELSPNLTAPPKGVQSAPLPSRFRQVEPGWERNPGSKDGRMTMMVKCVIGKEGVRRLSFLPAYTNQRAEPEFLSRNDPRFQEVLRYVEPQCKQLGTSLSVEGDEVVVFDAARK